MTMCFLWLIGPPFRCQPTGWLAESGEYASYSFFGSETLVWMAKVGFVFPKSVHNLNPHLELQNAGGPCQVIVNRWETHQLPRSLSPSGIWSQNSAHMSNETVDSVLHAYYIQISLSPSVHYQYILTSAF